MKKVIFISLFILGMIIPNINAKAVEVSDEQSLREAIAAGGYITLSNDIEVTEPLVIDKDVHISSFRNISIRGDQALITVNSGNVELDDISLYSGWNGKYDKYDNPDTVVAGQGMALVVNGGTVTVDGCNLYAGKVVLQLNGGNIKTFSSSNTPSIYGGEIEINNGYWTYTGGTGVEINGGIADLTDIDINAGKDGIVVNNSGIANVGDTYKNISSNQNGIQVNDGGTVNIISGNNQGVDVFEVTGKENAIYINGGTVNINGSIDLGSSTSGYGIYINKGYNTVTGGESLILSSEFAIGYYAKGSGVPNFSIYINPKINNLKLKDEKGFMSFKDNKVNLRFCSDSYTHDGSVTEDEGQEICRNIGSRDSKYDGPIYTNELDKCTVVYINGEKQNEVDPSCTPVTDNENKDNNPQIVEVPSTSLYGSVAIIILGIICILVSIFVTRRITNK